MPIRAADQHAIQAHIENASQHELERLRQDAEELLSSRQNPAVQARGLTPQERQYIEHMVEYLVRIECMEQDKGWWYRQKRRMQLLRSALSG